MDNNQNPYGFNQDTENGASPQNNTDPVQNVYGAPIVENSIAIERMSLERKQNNGRSSLLWIAGLSLVNMVLTLLNAPISFVFSLSLPSIFVGIGQELVAEYNSYTVLIVGVVLSLILIGAFFLLYVLSKKYFWPIVVALVLFSIDSLLLLGLILLDFSAIVSILIDVAFHVWALISIISLLNSTLKLKALDRQQF
jgi:hypothetical protein